MLIAGVPIIGACTLPIAGPTQPGTAKPTEPLYSSMTDGDVATANLAVQQALEYHVSGRIVRWSNPNSGNTGSVTPRRSFFLEDKGAFCRDYNEMLTIGGQSESYLDTACRDGTGKWIPID